MNLNDIFNQPNKLIIEQYFEAQERAIELYGENTVIFMEVGAFFEIYQSDKVGLAQEISNSLNIVLTRKNKNITKVDLKNPALCGVPTVSLDKHLDKLTQENKWTIIFVTQVGESPNITREVSKIISPGTNVDYIQSEDYNFIASLFIEKAKDNIVYCGLSMIDLSTGKVLSYENYGTKHDKNLALDEVKNIIRINNCSEILFTFEGFEDSEKLAISSDITIDQVSFNIKDASEIKKSLKISYQNDLLTEVFDLQTMLSPIEELDFERTPNALNALIVLINYISDHNMKVIKKLKRPIQVNNQKYLYVGNNALEQLNIIGQTNKESLVGIVNNGISAIGKRFITDQLTNPLVDKKEIERRYYLSTLFSDIELRNELKMNLREIYDIERLQRKVSLNTIAPFELFNTYSSLQKILDINSSILSNEELGKNISLCDTDIAQINSFLEEVNGLFDLTKLETFSFNNINSSFINKGRFEDLDQTISDLELAYRRLINMALAVSKLYSEEDEEIETQDPRNIKLSSVNIGFNDSEGFYFEITNKKSDQIEDFEDNLELLHGDYSIKRLKNSKKIYFKKVHLISNEIIALETGLIKKNKDVFKEYISEIDLSFSENVILYISNIEFFMNNALLKDKFFYNKPEIVETEDNSNFLEAIDLRHSIIERVQENETYVPNDLIMGNKKYAQNNDFVKELYQDSDNVNGILLYGINSSGKSSTMKSLGIAVILAQAGFFVPAKYFRYTLFESIFTRITGSDNIYKGLSTFAIEMLEMKNIFNRANEKTLVLGDEVAHGTETVSALSIVASAVNLLSERNSFFILATHLHKLKEIKEVSELDNVINAHLEVFYEEESHKLIYNRKLKPGQGSSIYGLEFAKYMQMDNKFLSTAYDIRSRLAEDLNSLESITRQKTSRYNKDKIVKSCEICGEPAKEEHHINEQKHADSNSMIGHIHKNHKSNLVDLCVSCHDKVHAGLISIEGWKTTSSGRSLIFDK